MVNKSKAKQAEKSATEQVKPAPKQEKPKAEQPKQEKPKPEQPKQENKKAEPPKQAAKQEKPKPQSPEKTKPKEQEKPAAPKQQNEKAKQREPSPKKPAKDGKKENGNGKHNGENHNHHEHVTLFKHPVLTTKIFAIVCWEQLVALGGLLNRFKVPVAICTAALIVPHLVHGPHTPMVQSFDEIAYFAAWWILLGVASSIGLGTGLHTFVLYLGPHIAKVTMAANECGFVPRMLPNRWSFHHFEACPQAKGHVSFWTILLSVQIEAFLWGLGTALGELPPYFVARAARLAGQKLEELEELEEEKSKKGLPLIERAKLIILAGLQRWGFITVVLSASIPNPLFDLAGITCGHFLFPFASFFGATFIGKAIIKVHIQMIFVIFVFSAHHVEHLLGFLESKIPFIHGSISKMLANQKKLLYSETDSISEKPLIGKLWDVFIIGMVVFFLVSIVNSSVNGYLADKRAKKEEAKESEKKKKKLN